MHALPGTIDLGELPHGDQPEILDHWPVRRRFQRWRARPTWRVAGAAAITALVLVMAAAAAPHPRPALTLQLAVHAADPNAVTDQQHLYVFEDTGSASETVVAAYRLADGTLAWRSRLSGEPANLGQWGEALLAMTYAQSPVEPGPVDRTFRLDPDSGRTLWDRAGWPVTMTGGRMVLSATELTADEGSHPATTIMAVDAETGHEVWHVEASQYDYDHDGAPARLVTLDAGSRLASYDLATGQLLAQAPTAALNDPLQDHYWAAMRTFGSVVLLTEELDGEPGLSAYDASTLQRRWTITGDQTLNLWPAPCGDLVCLLDLSGVPWAVDPDSGRTVWSADWLEPTGGGGGYDVVDMRLQGFPGYAVLSSAWGGLPSQRRTWMIDVDTGAPVLDLGRWQLSGGYGRSPGSSGAMLAMGTETGTWIGELRADVSGVDVLGRIDGATMNEHGYGTFCSPSAAFVVCFSDVLQSAPAPETNVQVWRIR